MLSNVKILNYFFLVSYKTPFHAEYSFVWRRSAITCNRWLDHDWTFTLCSVPFLFKVVGASFFSERLALVHLTLFLCRDPLINVGEPFRAKVVDVISGISLISLE